MSRCQHNWRYWNSGRGEHCNQPALPDRLYCKAHLEQALARVELVRNDSPKSWSGVVRGSEVGQMPRWRTVEA